MGSLNHSHRRWQLVVPPTIFWLLALVVATTLSADADVLLELKSTANVPYNSWNNANRTFMCSWEGVSCDSNSRVAFLDLFGTRERPLLRGTLPASLVQLDQLYRLYLQNNDLYGPFPMGILSSATLADLDISSTFLDLGSFPEPVTPSLRGLTISGLRYHGTLPDLNWGAIYRVHVTDLQFSCPFPQSFVDHINSGNTIRNCRMKGNKIFLTPDNLVCGQIPTEKFPCSFLPTVPVVVPEVNASSSTPPVGPVSRFFRIDHEDLALEFTRNEIFLFTTYANRAGGRSTYRREFIWIKFEPIEEEYHAPNDDSFFHTFPTAYWESFTWVNATRLVAKMGSVLNVTQEFIFDLVPSATGADGFVKFSFSITNNGYMWKDAQRPIDERLISMPFRTVFRLPHSLQNRKMICFPNVAFIGVCQGPLGNFSIGLDFGLQQYSLQMESNTTRASLKYPPSGTIDGRPLINNVNFVAFSSQFPSPLPNSDYIIGYERLGLTPPYSNQDLTLDEQFFAVTLELTLPRVMNLFYFDPDINIQLLFSPPDAADSSSGPVVPDLPAEAISGAVIAAAVVVPIICVIAIAVGAKFIFPYLKQRNEAASQALRSSEIEQHADEERTSSQRWTKAEPGIKHNPTT